MWSDIFYFLCSYLRTLGKFTWGDLIALLGFLVSILIFLYQMKKVRDERLLRQKETWYLEIIVKPRLDKLSEFYTDLVIYVCDSVNDLKNKEKSFSVKKIRIEKSNYINTILKKISIEIDPLSMLVKSYSMTLGEDVVDSEIKLQDEITQMINRYEEYNEDKITRSILQQYQILIMILNKGIYVGDELKKKKVEMFF